MTETMEHFILLGLAECWLPQAYQLNTATLCHSVVNAFSAGCKLITPIFVQQCCFALLKS